MKSKNWLLLAAGLIATVGALPGYAQETKHGQLVTEHLLSEKLRDTRTGLDPNRTIKIYLPPGYAQSGKSYPVIYYFHSLGSSNVRLFADGKVQKLFDRAITEKVVQAFILVAADYSTPTTGCFFENSTTTGHWLDFTMKELVPFIDRHFRTLPNRDSRGLAGDYMGGYGALKFALLYPEIFSVVYALNPVATGTGLVPMNSLANWKKMHDAKSAGDLEGDIYSQVFLAMAQAYLPNPDRPPFYCDFMVELENGELKPSIENTQKIQAAFLLDHLLPEKAGNLRTMRGIKFDWARYDPTQDHVYANQVFTRRLEELGIEHEAEEYRGNPWNKNWTDDGRVYCELLPFFNRHLVFQKTAD